MERRERTADRNDLTGWLWTGLMERIDQDRRIWDMKRGQKPSPEPVVLKLRPIEA